MKRNILVFIGGVTLTFFYVLLCGWLGLNFSIFGKIATESAASGRVPEYKEVMAKYGQDPFKQMEMVLRIARFFLYPLLSILVGIYVGLLARKNEVMVAGIALLPFVIFVTSSDTSRTSAFGFSIMYLSFSCITTHVVAGRRVARETSKYTSNQGNTPDAVR